MAPAPDPPNDPRPRWHRRWRERARANRATDLVWRASVLGIGSAVVVAGVIMLVVPGPGWAAIFVGLAILASEFAWAHALLARAKEWARRAGARVTDPAVRRRNLVLLGVAGVCAVVAAVWYVGAFGLTLDGPREWLAALR